MSKSRGEKGRSSAQPPPPPQVVVRDLIPGKINETQWVSLVDEEDGNEFINEIVEQIIQVTSEQIYDKEIEEEVIPYCVNRVDDYLSGLLKWRFLAHDKKISEKDEQSLWEEDEPPTQSTPDNWAEGVVPVVMQTESASKASPTPPCIDDKKLIEEIPLQSDDIIEDSLEGNDALSIKNEDISSSDIEFISRNETIGLSTELSELEKEKDLIPKKTSSTFRPYKGKMPAYRNVTLTPVTSSKKKACEIVCNHGSSRDIQLMQSAPNNSLYGNMKDKVNTMQKFTPERLPSRRIRTRFEVIGQFPEIEATPKSLGKKKLPKLRNHKPVNDKPSSNQTKLDTRIVHPLPPPLVDVMMLSPGVVAKVGDTIKSGPKLSKTAIKQL